MGEYDRYKIYGPNHRGQLLLYDRRDQVVIDVYDDTPDGRAEAHQRAADENRQHEAFVRATAGSDQLASDVLQAGV